MNRKLSLIISGTLIATLSMGIGAVAAFAYLAMPLQKWRYEFSEERFVWQSEALQSLRSGDAKSALHYLEFVAAWNINDLSEQKAAGAQVPSSFPVTKAVEYLCANPPVIPGVTSGEPKSIKQACASLGKSGAQPLRDGAASK